MKKFIIIIMFLNIILLSQTPQPLLFSPMNEETIHELQIQTILESLEKSIFEKKDLISYRLMDSNNKQDLTNLDILEGHETIDKIKINIKNIENISSVKLLVSAVIGIYTNGSLIKSDITLQFINHGGKWFLIKNELISNLLDRTLRNKKRDSQNSTMTSAITIVENNKTLLPMRFSSDPAIWEINKNLLEDNFSGSQFFSESAEIDGNIYVYGSSYDERVILFVDPVWARIVYLNKQTQAIK